MPPKPQRTTLSYHDLLVPLGVMCLAWFIYFRLAPLSLDTLAWKQGWPHLKDSFLPWDSFSLSAMTYALGQMLPAAFFGTGALWALSIPEGRLWQSATLWLGLSLVGLGLGFTQALVPSAGFSYDEFIGQQMGLLLGIVAWWITGLRFFSGTKGNRLSDSSLRYILIALCLLWIGLPLEATSPLTQVTIDGHFVSLGGYFSQVQERFYDLYKGVLLWVPVGLVFVFAERQQILKIWIIAAILSFGILATASMAELSIREVMEVIFGPIGIWAGIWIGERTRSLMPATIPTTAPQVSSSSASSTIQEPDKPISRSGSQTTIERLFELTDPSPSWSPPMDSQSEPENARSSFDLTALPRRLAALALLVPVAWAVWLFPRWELWLGLGLALYLLLLWKYPYGWLLVVPATLPMLDLAPWTGRFFFDEFDLVMAATVAMGLWHGSPRETKPTLGRPAILLLILFTLSYGISLLRGLWPLSPVDANAFTSYWSHYNALRVAKGFGWALLLMLMLRSQLPLWRERAPWLFTLGMGIGLFGVVLVGLWERWQFAGLLDFTANYRITATFSSMHTGGGHIEAYLVCAIPFLWLWLTRRRNPAVILAGIILFILSIYITTMTISRGGVLALTVALIVLAIGTLLERRASRSFTLWPLVVSGILLLAAGTVIVAGLSGGYFQKRLATVEQDWQTRLNHWDQALAMMDDNGSTRLLGMGLGRFPETYLLHHLGDDRPGTYRFEQDDGNRFLRLGAGETLYMAQRVFLRPRTDYLLTVDLRSNDPEARLDIPLCEKHLLDSHRCHWQGVSLADGDSQWQHREIQFNSGEIGSGHWLSRRPVELFFHNPAPDTVVDVDNVHLVQRENGKDLIRNGDFSQGGDHWFFKTHSHLPWHIKNLWVQILFEQGWLGLLSFLLLVGALLIPLGMAMWQGNIIATIFLSAVAGFLTVGLFSSQFDAPRLTLLFFTLLFFGALTTNPKPSHLTSRLPRARSDREDFFRA